MSGLTTVAMEEVFERHELATGFLHTPVTVITFVLCCFFFKVGLSEIVESEQYEHELYPLDTSGTLLCPG